MTVTVNVSGRRFEEAPISMPTLLREIGTFALRLIRTRTERMTDVHGAPFRPLSAAYAARKAKAGLPPMPNLQVSGRMLNDMTIVEVGDRQVSIGFTSSGSTPLRTGRRGSRAVRSALAGATFIQRSRAVGAADKAFFHTETGAGRSQVKREFFALSDQDETAIEAAVERYLDSVWPE